MAAGQGSAARACLLERVPYFGFVLGEQHGKKLEMQLTDFLLEEMRREGSTHYRPEAAKAPETADEPEEKTGKPEKKREKPTTKSEVEPKKRKTRLKPKRSHKKLQLTGRKVKKKKQSKAVPLCLGKFGEL